MIDTLHRGNLIFLVALAIPILGFILAITLNNLWWLILLAPLFVFMEGGLFLIALAVFAAITVIG